jgi:hypothetical protein
VAVAEEQAGIDDGGGDRQSREQQGLREFWDEKRNDKGQATIYRFEKFKTKIATDKLNTY